MGKKDPTVLHLTNMIAWDLGILDDLLRAANSIVFSFELARLAYRKDAVNLEKWLTALFVGRGMSIVSTVTTQLAAKLQLKEGQEAAQMPLDAVRLIFRCFVTPCF